MRAPKLLAALCMFVGASLAASGSAGAAAPPVGVILSQLEADPEQQELAGSLDLLLRSMLGPGQRGLISNRELGMALEILSGGRRRQSLIVDPSQAKALMERLTADRTVLGKLTVDATRWEVRGQILGPDGDRLTSVAVQVPPGELHALASQLAQRLAQRIGLNALERPPVNLDTLRPYARAQSQLNAGDPRGAAGTLERADPRAITTVSAVKEVVESLAINPAVPPTGRMQMSLLAGDHGNAKQTADEILKAEPTHVQARAGKVRAMTGMGDLENAINEFEPIKSAKDPFAAAANVALLVKRRYSPDRKALANGKVTEEDQIQSLAMNLKDPDGDARPTLAFMSGAPPNALPADVENAAVGAAERVAAKDPDLAASVAGRALKGGVQVDRALPLAQVHKLDKAELTAVKEKLDAIGPQAASASKALGAELEKRDGQAQKLRLGGLELVASDPEVEALALKLRGLLGHFGVLQEQTGQRVLILGRQQTEATWYQPFQVRRARLDHGLARGAWDKPFEMSLVAAAPGNDTLPTNRLTEAALANLVEQQGADLVLVHNGRADGMDVDVELILFDGANGTAYRTSGKVPGMAHGLLSINIVPFVAMALLLAFPLVLFKLRRRVGEIVVRVAANDTSERRFYLLLSPSAKPPKIADAKQHAEEYDKNTRNRNKLLVKVTEASTSFERVPPGRWFVHLYGTYKTGKIVHTLSGEEFTQVAELKPQEVVPVSFSLTVSSAEFHVTVQDKNKPLIGVPVWIDNERDKAVKTNEEGLAVLKVPLGQRILRAEAGGMLVEKTHVVIKRKAHVLVINLDWERKVDDVSRALDNDPDVIAARSSSATMPAQTSSATLPRQSNSQLPAQTGSEMTPAQRSAAERAAQMDPSVSLPPEFLPPPDSAGH